MNKTDLVKKWVRKTGAADVVGGAEKAFSLGWKLLNACLYFRETGCYLDGGQELYDYTCFLHEFADRHAGCDDDLYLWLVNNGLKIVDGRPRELSGGEIPNTTCPLCGRKLNSQAVARKDDGTLQISAVGRAWCRDCADYFGEIKQDNIS